MFSDQCSLLRVKCLVFSILYVSALCLAIVVYYLLQSDQCSVFIVECSLLSSKLLVIRVQSNVR